LSQLPEDMDYLSLLADCRMMVMTVACMVV